jgi:hypothetical protein
MELKSLSQRIECARMKSWCLGMIIECLDDSSMRLGVPFIAPRQLGAVGGILGRQFLHCPVRISFLKWHSRPLQNCSRWRTGHCPVHTGQSGAPSRPLAGAARRARIAQPTVALAAVGSPDSPMNYSRTPPTNSREWPVR